MCNVGKNHTDSFNKYIMTITYVPGTLKSEDIGVNQVNLY